MKEFKTPWAETYPGLLRNHGYFVAHIGKWHNGAFPVQNFDFGRAYHPKYRNEFSRKGTQRSQKQRLACDSVMVR